MPRDALAGNPELLAGGPVVRDASGAWCSFRDDSGGNFVNTAAATVEVPSPPMSSDHFAVESRPWSAAEQLWANIVRP